MLPENLEAITEIFSIVGVEATDKQMQEIAEGYEQHIDCMREMQSYQFISSANKSCDRCEILKQEIQALKKNIEIYQNSVKRRHKADRVWLEGDSVMYER